MVRTFSKNDTYYKATVTHQIHVELEIEVGLSPDHKVTLKNRVEQVRSGAARVTTAEEINVDAERSLWLLVTFDFDARELTVSMLVARVHTDSRESN